ncbi:MAG: hypothetical protein OXI66_14315 [Boseongicola sp.]|nr:hypothetical protein [Boseongicola sp.]
MTAALQVRLLAVSARDHVEPAVGISVLSYVPANPLATSNRDPPVKTAKDLQRAPALHQLAILYSELVLRHLSGN